MKIGMFTALYQWNPLEQAFDDCKRFGYDFIELYGARPHAFAPDLARGEIKEVKRLIDKYEVPVPIYSPEHNLYGYNYMLGTEAQWEDIMHYMCLCLDITKELGAHSMLTSVAAGEYMATDRELWARLEKSLRVMTDHAEKLGINIIVETLTPYETNFFTRANDLVELFERIDSPCLKGMCDVVPPFVQYENIMSYVDKLKSKLVHMHFIDGKNGSDDHLIPGEGEIPLKELMADLKESGYQGTVTLELVGKYINEPRLYTRRAIEQFRKIQEG